MAKKWVAMIGITLLIVGLCVMESNYIQDSFEFLLNRLDAIEVKLEASGETIATTENIASLNELHQEWREKTKNLKMIVWHTGMKEVEINLSRIQSYIEVNNQEEAMVELHALQDFSRHYKDDFTITVENIL